MESIPALVSCVGYNACLLKNDKFLKPYNLHKEQEKNKYVFISVDEKSPPVNGTSECDKSWIVIANFCSTHWNPPSHKSSSDCNHMIDWHSPISCPVQSTNYEKPCYTYDTFGGLIDLTPWIRSNGSSYEVDTGSFNQTIKKFNLNVCNEAIEPCGPNVSSCFIGNNTTIESGFHNLTSIKYDNKEKTVILTSLGQYNELCSDHRVKTVTRFVCKNRVIGNSKPRLVRANACENIIEWQTIHACPVSEYMVPATNCSINYEPQGIKIDIKRIVKNATRVEVKDLVIDGKKKNVMIGLCQGIKPYELKCAGKSNAATTSCLYDAGSKSPLNLTKDNSEIIGSIAKSFIKLGDGKVYLESFAHNKTCNIPIGRKLNVTHPVGTRIEFVCSDTTDDKPKFLGYNECIYQFEWGSNLVCLEGLKNNISVTNRTDGSQSVKLTDKDLKIDLNEQPKNAQDKHQETLRDSQIMNISEKSPSDNNGSAANSTKDAPPKEPNIPVVVQPQSNSRMNKLHKFFMIALIVMSLAGFIVVILILDRKTQFRFPLGNMRRQARQAFQPQPVPYTRVDQFNDLDL